MSCTARESIFRGNHIFTNLNLPIWWWAAGMEETLPPSEHTEAMTIDSRAWNGVRIWRVLLVSVPTCNRSFIYHNRRVWQIKSTRSCRSIFHGDHQIQLSQLLETQHFSAKLCPFWSYWHLCKANSAYGAITSCKIQFWMSFHLLSTSLPADFATNRLATVPLRRTRESQLDIGDSSL